MTRHELKEQVQHDPFSERVFGAVQYAKSHRTAAIRWASIGIAGLAIAGGVGWYFSSQKNTRRQDLASAMAVVESSVGPSNPYAKTFPTEDAQQDAAITALSSVLSKHGGSNEGLIAQYYRGALKIRKNDKTGAEADFKAVADSSSDAAPLAKIALAQLYAGDKKMNEAQAILRGMVNDPSALVSKAQAQILLAQLSQTSNPQEAKTILKSLSAGEQERPAVKSAADMLNQQLSK